jgi:ABC-2 type transport system ATP-binding protein
MPSPRISATTLRDGGVAQLHELAVVDGDVGLAPRRVGGARGARNLALDARQHGLHAREVGGARGRVLLVALLDPAVGRGQQRHRAVLRHDGVDRPGADEGQAPAHRPPGDRHHRQPRGLEVGERLQRVRRDRAVVGQRVVDVGEHADERAARGCHPLGQRQQVVGRGGQEDEDKDEDEDKEEDEAGMARNPWGAAIVPAHSCSIPPPVIHPAPQGAVRRPRPRSMPMPHILVDRLLKTYRISERDPGVMGALRGLVQRRHRTVEALSGVSFSLERGELLGFIGPNGAGKSTTIKILAGILRPDGGRVEVDGRDPFADRERHVARIGVVFGQRTQLWWDLPVGDGFDLLRDIYRVDPVRYRRTRDELVALLHLERVLDQPVRQLSLGQRMRAEIAAALLHEPDIVFLDEPTIGLDAPSKLAVRDFVRRANRERGTTVLLTTHDMHDIEALARRVIIIGHGRVLADSPVEALRAQVMAERRLVVDFAQDAELPVQVEGARVHSRDGQTLVLDFDPSVTAAPALIARIAGAHAVEDIRLEGLAIEAVIARFYAMHGAGEA